MEPGGSYAYITLQFTDEARKQRPVLPPNVTLTLQELWIIDNYSVTQPALLRTFYEDEETEEWVWSAWTDPTQEGEPEVTRAKAVQTMQDLREEMGGVSFGLVTDEFGMLEAEEEQTMRWVNEHPESIDSVWLQVEESAPWVLLPKGGVADDDDNDRFIYIIPYLLDPRS